MYCINHGLLCSDCRMHMILIPDSLYDNRVYKCLIAVAAQNIPVLEYLLCTIENKPKKNNAFITLLVITKFV